MSPRKRNAEKDKKKKNLKDSPAEDLFTEDWPSLSLWSSKALEKVSHPATSRDTSRFNLLQRKSGGTVDSTPTPADTTLNNSEIKSSDSLTSSKNKDKNGKLANYLSALSGSSPDKSTIERNRSEDSKYSYKYPSSGDKSFNSFFQDTTPKHPSRILPLKQITDTDAKMVNFPPPNLDTDLKHIVTLILNLAMTHPLALGLSQSYVNTSDDFRTIDIDDVHDFRYNRTTDPPDTPGTKIHIQVVKKIQRMACYARFKEESMDTDCDTPNLWDIDTYSKWCNNGYAT
jgi:hypothetical protein